MEFLKLGGSIIGSIVSRAIADELKAWNPTLVDKLTSIAIKRLPPDHRERFAEEWESDLDSIPGGISKVLYAFGLIQAAGRISVQFKSRAFSSRNTLARRCLDLLAGAFCFIASLPVMVLIAVAIKVTSPGPIISSEECIGKNGTRFMIRRFRTSYINSREILAEFVHNNPEILKQWMEEGRITNDPRVTRVGRFLLRTTIAEIPQFWNVLRGEMSLIGLPPLRSVHYTNATTAYNSKKPGLTNLGYPKDGSIGKSSLLVNLKEFLRGIFSTIEPDK
jgi:lipopolysaccharide/colanic/teichoic acid biosynthesis glycosyltransferase